MSGAKSRQALRSLKYKEATELMKLADMKFKPGDNYKNLSIKQLDAYIKEANEKINKKDQLFNYTKEIVSKILDENDLQASHIDDLSFKLKNKYADKAFLISKILRENKSFYHSFKLKNPDTAIEKKDETVYVDEDYYDVNDEIDIDIDRQLYVITFLTLSNILNDAKIVVNLKFINVDKEVRSRFYTLSEAFINKLIYFLIHGFAIHKVVTPETVITSDMEVVSEMYTAISVKLINPEMHYKPRKDVYVTDEEKALLEAVNEFFITSNYEHKTGSFFNYYLNIPYTKFLEEMFERYQIYYKYKENVYEDNCLIYALKQSKLFKDEEIDSLKCLCKSRFFPKKDLNKITDILKCRIILSTHDKDSNKMILAKYGDKKLEKEVKLGLVDKHFFIFENTKITSYAIKNIFKIFEKEDFNKIYNEKNHKKEDRFINSYSLIKLLIENKATHLKNIPGEDLLKTQYNDKLDMDNVIDITESSIHDNDCVETIYKKKEKNYSNIVFADCETITTNLHKEYMVYGFRINFEDYNTYLAKEYKNSTEIYEALNKISIPCYSVGENSFYSFFEQIPDNSIIYFHNAGYDGRICLKYLKEVRMTEKGNKIFKMQGIFWNKAGKRIHIEIRDSLALIPVSLDKFDRMFGISIAKEVMPYSLYTEENIKKVYLPIEDALNCIGNKENRNQFESIEAALEALKISKNEDALNFIKDEEKRKQFKKNVKEWNCKQEKNFNIIKYSAKYCIRDCEVLRDGFFMFSKMLNKISNIVDEEIFDLHENLYNKLDPIEHITISSLADNFLIKNGCYDDVYSLSGIVRCFIQKSVVGGRVMAAFNKKHYFDGTKTGNKIDLLDACSLYPSAMVRLGFLKGKPKALETSKDHTYEEIQKYDGYFVRIKLLCDEIKIKRAFPLLSYIHPITKTRTFSDDMKYYKYNYIYIDKISLEDLVKFHGISPNDIQVIDGFYFNEGFNTIHQKIVHLIYKKRSEYKRQKNPLNEVCKLMLNSMYGKTIMKPVSKEKKIFDNAAKCIKYVMTNYNSIDYFKNMEGSSKWVIKVIKPIIDHSTRPQIGSTILSMSKRVMNEIIAYAEDLGCEILYQDTDSLHILKYNKEKKDMVQYLNEEFKKLNGYDVLGNELGQIKSDFEIDGSLKMRPLEGDKCYYAIRNITLGKKVYLDELECLNEKNEKCLQYHVRCKGINGNVLQAKAKKHNTTVFDIYQQLFNGKKVRFDMKSDGKIKFVYNDTYGVSTHKTKFTRALQF